MISLRIFFIFCFEIHLGFLKFKNELKHREHLALIDIRNIAIVLLIKLRYLRDTKRHDSKQFLKLIVFEVYHKSANYL